MIGSYKQSFVGVPDAYFSNAMSGEVQKSEINVPYTVYDTLNAGELHPIECIEMLPNHSVSLDLDCVIRQNTVLNPTMGALTAQIFAFFVPNRIVNESWKNVQGENTSGSWTAPAVQLAPLSASADPPVQIPVGSVADCYDLPTQQVMPVEVLHQCNDLPFRGYVEIYNEYFRDQNYQPPIPYSKLNVYNGFLRPLGTKIGFDNILNSLSSEVDLEDDVTDGSFAHGALLKALVGPGGSLERDFMLRSPVVRGSRTVAFSALGAPLKVNKMHDYFTSVLPSTQKGPSVFVPVQNVESTTPVRVYPLESLKNSSLSHLKDVGHISYWNPAQNPPVGSLGLHNDSTADPRGVVGGSVTVGTLDFCNLGFYASELGAELSVSDLRLAAAIQQVYELMARGGTRYRSIVRTFFGIDLVDPFYDLPCRLDGNRLRFELDLFQTAQTSASQEGSPQGNLAAFGYTNKSGHLFHYTAVEHGYIHIFCVIRQRNIYPSFMRKSWFRMNQLDWYMPPLANLSEQPIYRAEINPFAQNPKAPFGYQEPWADYRFFPDRVKGFMRPGVEGSLSVWNYADDFDSSLEIADGAWLRSNAKEVVDRTLALTSSVAPQFKAQFHFRLRDELPMPVYSVPGLDII